MTEDKYMDSVRAVWQSRARELGLKMGSVSRGKDLAAFLQGALAMATATGIMTKERAGTIAFLVMVSRGEEFMQIKEAVTA